MTDADAFHDGGFQVAEFPSDSKDALPVKQTILSALKRLRYGESAVFSIKLALEEAIANAIKHGNANDPGKKVTVRFRIDKDEAAFSVRDEGPGFLPEKVPDCTSPDRLPLPNGRGIMLMRAYMDEVCYQDRGREVYFMKRRLRAGGGSRKKKGPKDVRRTIHYSGHVQGVGFRYMAETIAGRFSVTGFVRNLSDGRVEMVVEGDELELDRFEREVESAMQNNICNCTCAESPATGEFECFCIGK